MNLPPADPDHEGRPESDSAGTAATDSEVAAVPAKPVVRTPVSRKMLDEVFGDVLPNVTRDELDDGPDQGSRSADRDRWYRDNRPPHHG